MFCCSSNPSIHPSFERGKRELKMGGKERQEDRKQRQTRQQERDREGKKKKKKGIFPSSLLSIRHCLFSAFIPGKEAIVGNLRISSHPEEIRISNPSSPRRLRPGGEEQPPGPSPPSWFWKRTKSLGSGNHNMHFSWIRSRRSDDAASRHTEYPPRDRNAGGLSECVSTRPQTSSWIGNSGLEVFCSSEALDAPCEGSPAMDGAVPDHPSRPPPDFQMMMMMMMMNCGGALHVGTSRIPEVSDPCGDADPRGGREGFRSWHSSRNCTSRGQRTDGCAPGNRAGSWSGRLHRRCQRPEELPSKSLMEQHLLNCLVLLPRMMLMMDDRGSDPMNEDWS